MLLSLVLRLATLSSHFMSPSKIFSPFSPPSLPFHLSQDVLVSLFSLQSQKRLEAFPSRDSNQAAYHCECKLNALPTEPPIGLLQLVRLGAFPSRDSNQAAYHCECKLNALPTEPPLGLLQLVRLVPSQAETRTRQPTIVNVSLTLYQLSLL